MTTSTRTSVAKVLWFLLLIAIVVVWWYFRRPANESASESESDPVADWSMADPDDVLIDLRDDVSERAIRDIETTWGVELQLVSDQSRDEAFYRAHISSDRRDAFIAALAARPDVEVVEPDMMMSIGHDAALAHSHGFGPGLEDAAVSVAGAAAQHAGYPNDPLYSLQWHMRQIGMPEAWKLADGGGITVAVLDTGVGYESHGAFALLPDLAGLEFVHPFDFVGNDIHANDDHGHGSHVAGTIAQVTNNALGVTGIARNVKIMPLKVLSGAGSGSVAGIADAIRYAADKGAKVINMSLGGPLPSRVLKNAVAYAREKGVIVVCAAGNDGRGKVGYPASYPGAFAVAATQFDETTTFYSNYGKDIDIAAPGGNTRVDQNGDGLPDGVVQNTIAIRDPSSNDYYGYMGTSMASPHVAGVAALIIGEGITDIDRVEGILRSSARKPASGYSTDRYGAGILDADAAVKAARTSDGTLQAGLALLLAAAVGASVQRRRGGLGFFAAAVFSGAGLFFLPWLAPDASSMFGIEMLTRGVPSWDIALLGPLDHGHALAFSALLPLALFGLAYGVPRARPILAGVAVGVAAHLVYFAAAGTLDVRYVPGTGLDALWLFANAALCTLLARLALRTSLT